MKVCNILDDIGINYEIEKLYGKYSIDIYLVDYDLCIEIMGKYWHLDNRLYEEKTKYKTQSGIVEKDARKKKYIESWGTKILYLWEIGISANEELCKNLLLMFIRNPDNIKSYHSSDYCIKDNDIEFYPKQKQYLEVYLERLNEMGA